MIPQEIMHRLEQEHTRPTNLSPSNREKKRQEIKQQMDEFFAQGKKVIEFPYCASGYYGGKVGIYVSPTNERLTRAKTTKKAA